MGHRMLLIAISPTDPRCHGNEIWDKIGYNSACVRYFCKIFALTDDVTTLEKRTKIGITSSDLLRRRIGHVDFRMTPRP